MNNYHFKIATDKFEKSIYVLAETYNMALDILFKDNFFFVYEFQGVVWVLLFFAIQRLTLIKRVNLFSHGEKLAKANF